MKSALMMAAMPAVVMAFSDSAEQWLERPAAQGGAFSAWRCGHALNETTVGKNGTVTDSEFVEQRALRNPLAGIVFFQDGSLDHIRTNAAELAAANQATQAKYLANDFDSLFCSDYISGYKNNAAANASAGVCIQNIGVGSKWDAILTADKAARDSWNYFGTSYGYQKSVGVNKSHPNPDYPTLWGSGRSGSNPSNWCAAYMKQTLCQIAFPQYAEATAPADLQNGGLGARVRPVCRDWCTTVLNNCNRREPDCYDCSAPWANNYTNPQGFFTNRNYSLKFENALYCSAWNRGYDQFGIARAGTGVGAGPDEKNEKFCAAWDAAPSMAPMSLFAVAVAVLVAVL